MDPKLEAALEHLCARLGSLGRTQACKLPYLVDVIAERVLGQRITDGSHETWKHGVVTKEVFNATDPTSPAKGFAVETYSGGYGGYEIRLADRTPTDSSLSEEEIEIVEYVAQEFGRRGAGALGELTKSMNPGVDDDEWGLSLDADTSRDAYIRLLSPSWRNFWAKRRLIDVSDESQWGEPIDDPEEFARLTLNG